MATTSFNISSFVGMPTSQAVANSLSTITIMSCMFLKVPQIANIIAKKSADGIYIQALAMEIIGFTIMTLYNYTSQYSVMTYMEYPIILVQVYVMLYLVLKYRCLMNKPFVPLLISIYFAAIAGVLLEIVPNEAISYLVPLCTPLSGSAKVTYIYGIIKTGKADNVSLTTWILSMLTNMARVFTVYVDSSDTKLMANFFISTILSFGVLVTALYYQKKAAPVPQRQRRKSTRRRSRAD